MFIKEYSDSILKNTRTIKIKCLNCNNESEHVICIHHKMGVGFIFLKDPILSLKKYYLVCPICSNISKELTKEQVDSYRI